MKIELKVVKKILSVKDYKMSLSSSVIKGSKDFPQHLSCDSVHNHPLFTSPEL